MTETKLPNIPVFDVGPDFAMAVTERVGSRALALLESATGHVSKRALMAADFLSRRWLLRNCSPYLAEIEALANRAGRPGIYFLNVSYEWGCTTAARSASDRLTAVLQRTLDWDVNGIGRHVVAARIANPLGAWISFTWPAFTGVVQAVAPGRFAAAINQPTLPRRLGVESLDRLVSHGGIWRSKFIQPIHLLRQVFETAPDYETARTILETTPVTTPVIFTLAGIRADETVTIERLPKQSVTIQDAFTANEWRAISPERRHHPAFENEARLNAMRTASVGLDPEFSWVRWPILNPDTRLALIANPSTGEIMARGYESGTPATRSLMLREPVLSSSGRKLSAE